MVRSVAHEATCKPCFLKYLSITVLLVANRTCTKSLQIPKILWGEEKKKKKKFWNFLWIVFFIWNTLRKKCLYSEFFWFVFFRIWTEYWQIRNISPYSVWMWENTDKKRTKYRRFLRSDKCLLLLSVTQMISKLMLNDVLSVKNGKNGKNVDF